jgi:hypothetical protein
MYEPPSKPYAVMQAQPFCYGPTAASLSMAALLRAMGLAIVHLAEGTSLQLLQAGGHPDRVIPFQAASPEDQRRRACLVESADLVIVTMDPAFAEFTLARNPRTVYLDCLYWMWDELPEVIHRCALYVYEDFPDDESQVNRLGLPANALRIGSFCDATPVRRRPGPPGDHLLVSVGGLHRSGRLFADLLNRYQRMIRQAVKDALMGLHEFRTVYFAVGVDPEESTLPGGVVFRAAPLAHTEYLEVLATSRAALIIPSLRSFHEVVTAGVPLFLLPPHNYSQHLQLQAFQRVLPPGCYCGWRQMGITGSLPRYLTVEENRLHVEAALEHIDARGDVLADSLRGFFTSAWRSYDPAPPAELIATLRERNTGAMEQLVGKIMALLPAR